MFTSALIPLEQINAYKELENKNIHYSLKKILLQGKDIFK